MNEAKIRQHLMETDALLKGHFVLRSGLHSDQFFQCANLLRFPDRAAQLCQALVDKASAELDFAGVESVISPALGGIIVGHEVARALGVKSIFAEKQDGKLVMRRFAIQPGAEYVVAEDVITRGGRVQECIDLVRAGGGQVVAVLVLVDRSGGAAQFDAPLYSLLRMVPEVWEPAVCPLCARGEAVLRPGS